MTLTQAIILGVVQGITEFLPISSSGHLVIVPFLLHWQIPAEQAFVFDVLIQVATLLAVIIYFWKDLFHILRAWITGIIQRRPFGDPYAQTGWLLILASIPAGVIGIILKDQIEAAFNDPLATGLFLLVTAGLLLLGERLGKRSRKLENLTWQDSLWIGFAQALAIFPGISRSGATITGGMTRGLQRADSARFSFLMSVPIMLAAGLLASLDLLKMSWAMQFLPILLPGFLAASVCGYLSIRWLISYLSRQPLYIFIIYCALLGVITVITAIVTG